MKRAWFALTILFAGFCIVRFSKIFLSLPLPLFFSHLSLALWGKDNFGKAVDKLCVNIRGPGKIFILR